MGVSFDTTEIVLLFDYYSLESQDLYESFQKAGKNYPAFVIEDEGFLPDNVESVYGYFLGDFKNAANIPRKPLYFNQIKVPKYWEISGNNHSGKIHNLNKERGRIFYAQPEHQRLVKVVDWCDETGVVRSSDHYNRYGALYARTIFNFKGQKVNKTYFSPLGKEIIVENYVTGDIILNEDEKVRIFHTKTDFVLYFLEKAGFMQSRIFFNSLSTPFFVSQRMNSNGKGDILFWQEDIRNEIPGNMQIILDGKSTRTKEILVQKKEAYDRLLALGASNTIIQKLGYAYNFNKENNYSSEILICTNSERILECQKLVQELPQIHFHIAALTEMSSKLMSMGSYENVTLYPGVKRNILKELFEKCDIYLDINCEGEIVSAVRTAFLHNHIILAFKETIHNGDYIAKEHIFAAKDVEQMIMELKKIAGDYFVSNSYLERQHSWAMVEKVSTYQNREW